MTEEEKTTQRQLWQEELAKIEEEIQTLKQVLQSKQRESQELKKKLGITVWKELTDDFSQGVRNVRESNVYQKTESAVKATAESTRSLIGGLTEGFTQKIGQLKNSESFRSLEEKMGSAYENVKTKMSSSRSNSIQSFNEALCQETGVKNITPTTPTIPEGESLS
ncbi:Tumor protein D52, putative [Pediculus humanus corporis]|uniref:Tumor protein D52, putative n=1 Tax=Pediculus humanus subsp. corporis TaxID=121224 RepID=E0W408_PEDHC|nr:Tumor protein D52, putative [Pediculus humanus corporis]EEB20364.1 Tumor protein D52, putative [Pediculus humanus corporis]